MLDAFVQSLALFRDKTPQCGTIDICCGATYVNVSELFETTHFLYVAGEWIKFRFWLVDKCFIFCAVMLGCCCYTFRFLCDKVFTADAVRFFGERSVTISVCPLALANFSAFPFWAFGLTRGSCSSLWTTARWPRLLALMIARLFWADGSTRWSFNRRSTTVKCPFHSPSQ